MIVLFIERLTKIFAVAHRPNPGLDLKEKIILTKMVQIVLLMYTLLIE